MSYSYSEVIESVTVSEALLSFWANCFYSKSYCRREQHNQSVEDQEKSSTFSTKDVNQCVV